MADETKTKLMHSLRLTEALLDAMETALRNSDPGDVWRYASFRAFMRKYNELVSATNEIERVAAPVDYFDMNKVPANTNTIAMTQQDLFETTRANLHILKAYLTNRVGLKADRAIEMADFLQANLRRAVLHTPERERDVQDVIEQLLIGRGLEKGFDYDREVGRVKVSTKEVVPDFILAPVGLALEVKFLKDRAGTARIIDEINADIRSYGKAYDSLLFVINDVGIIRDEVEFRRDLESDDAVRVIVVKH